MFLDYQNISELYTKGYSKKKNPRRNKSKYVKEIDYNVDCLFCFIAGLFLMFFAYTVVGG